MIILTAGFSQFLSVNRKGMNDWLFNFEWIIYNRVNHKTSYFDSFRGNVRK